MKPLKSWTPKHLERLYQIEAAKTTQNNYTLKQKQTQGKKIDALYRLSTYEDMKDVWENLLSRDAVTIKYNVEKEIALVSGIHEFIWKYGFGDNPPRPKDKDDQLWEIASKIKELQRLIAKSPEAGFENLNTIESLLHKKNLEYRNEKGEKKSFPEDLSWLKFNDGNALIEYSQITLDEHMPWNDRTPTQRLGWWTKEAMALSLTEVLEFYAKRMGDYSKIYNANYAKDTSKISRGLSWLMNNLYSKYLDDYVARIMNVILDTDSWDKDNVRKNRTYKKNKYKGKFLK